MIGGRASIVRRRRLASRANPMAALGYWRMGDLVWQNELG